MKCTKCGKVVKKEDKFCSNCGITLITVKKSPATTAILNFFIWGLGYLYIGKYVGWGILLIIISILAGLGGSIYSGLGDQLLYYGLLLPIDIAFAWHGYKITQEINQG